MTREEERKQDRKCLAEVHAWKRKAAKRREGMTPDEELEYINRRAFKLLLDRGMVKNITPDGLQFCAERGMLKNLSPENAEYCAQYGILVSPAHTTNTAEP